MKYLVLFVVAFLIGALGVYVWQSSESMDAQEDLLRQINSLESEVSELKQGVPLGENYENNSYGFSLSFPKTWGNIDENVTSWDGEPSMRQVTLTSGNDSDRYIMINIVNLEHENEPTIVDYPHTMITKTGRFVFYYTSGGDCAGMPGCENQKFHDIKAEVDVIIASFDLEYRVSYFCTSAPVETDIGRTSLPTDPTYDHLGLLGEFFTASECGGARVNDLWAVTENMYTMGVRIALDGKPSEMLLSTLQEIGFSCTTENTEPAECKEWHRSDPIATNDLMKLKPYHQSIRADDCVHCG